MPFGRLARTPFFLARRGINLSVVPDTIPGDIPSSFQHYHNDTTTAESSTSSQVHPFRRQPRTS
ncbi:hypothetical protein [Bifidobacterium myosotis]|uniref:Uncharacterized protein n=1 Tax=Bifidobacterium myosotis TaxID=1630166 RepID=A0A5M9ZSC0_9BIFI|nr:hypothetical protein [Bifidobacterium myosotis]KAA8829722.1 hypothetical protein EMO91_01760 [Bifidobacterium myosotis]